MSLQALADLNIADNLRTTRGKYASTISPRTFIEKYLTATAFYLPPLQQVLYVARHYQTCTWSCNYLPSDALFRELWLQIRWWRQTVPLARGIINSYSTHYNLCDAHDSSHLIAEILIVWGLARVQSWLVWWHGRSDLSIIWNKGSRVAWAVQMPELNIMDNGLYVASDQREVQAIWPRSAKQVCYVSCFSVC